MSLKKFFIQYSHFFARNAIATLLGLISFPILTRLLTREEYGIMSLINTTMFFMASFSKGGLSDGIIRFYKEYSETPDRVTTFSSTVLVRGLVFSILGVLLYVIVAFFMSKYMINNGAYLLCFLIMSAFLLFRPLNTIVLNILRATDRTIFYNIVNLVGKITAIGGSLFFLLYVIGNFYGYFIGQVVSELLMTIVLFYWFFKNFNIRISKVSGTLAGKLIKFGIPLLFSEILYLLLAYADRYMIITYMSEGDLGLYSVGYNLASYISNMVMFSLSYTVIPLYVSLYQHEGREKTEAFLEKCLHYLLIAIIPMFFGYYVIADDLFIGLASEKYSSAAAFSPIILLGSFFLGVNTILNAGLYLQKKSKLILFIMFIAVATNILLNIVLITNYGIMGAAIATLIASMATTALTILFSNKHITVRIKPLTVVYYTALSLIMVLSVSTFDIKLVWIDMTAKVLIGAAIIISGTLAKESELRAKLMSLKIVKRIF